MSKTTFEDLHAKIYANICKAITKDGGKINHGHNIVELVNVITNSSIDLATKLISVEEENARLRATIQRNEVRL